MKNGKSTFAIKLYIVKITEIEQRTNPAKVNNFAEFRFIKLQLDYK